MSVKGSPVSQGSSASIALAPMAVARAPKAWWEMAQRVQVSVGILYKKFNCLECVTLRKLH